MTAPNSQRKAKLARSQKLGDSTTIEQPAMFNPIKWLWVDFFEFGNVRINQDWVLLTIGIIAAIALFVNVSPMITSLVRGSELYSIIGEGNWMLIYATISGITWAIRTHIPLEITLLATVSAVLSSLPLLAISGIDAGWLGYWLAQLLVMASLPIDFIVLFYTAILLVSLIPLGNPLFHLSLLMRDWSRVLNVEPEAKPLKKKTTVKASKTAAPSGAAQWMQEVLATCGIPAQVVNVMDSHRRTVFEIRTPPKFKVKQLTRDIEDIQNAAGRKPISIETSVTNKPGICRLMIPKLETPKPLPLSNLMQTDGFKKSHRLALPMGQNLEGNPEYRRLDKMPHLLIGGTSGGGKSVSVNTFITSLIVKNTPEQLQLILIDPKIVEFIIYENTPHLAMPVVTKMEECQDTIQRLNNEMEYRYQLMAAFKVRSLGELNTKLGKREVKNPLYGSSAEFTDDKTPISSIGPTVKALPTLVMIIDEMADLIIRFKEVEELIATLAGKARASGIHLIPCTQNPLATVVTSLIKANITTRYSLQVATSVDSETILGKGRTEAKSLLGNGDAYLLDGSNSVNVQSYYIEADEIEAIINNQNQST